MRKRFIIAFSTIFLTLFFDQWIKVYIKLNFFYGETVPLIGEWFDLHFVENPGMAFGMEFGGVWGKIALSLFRVGAVVAIWLIIRNLLNNKAKKGLIFSVGLIFAGALGNILDSAFYGLMFNSGTSWDPELMRWVSYYDVSQLNFDSYAGFFQGCVVDMIHFEFFLLLLL